MDNKITTIKMDHSTIVIVTDDKLILAAQARYNKAHRMVGLLFTYVYVPIYERK